MTQERNIKMPIGVGLCPLMLMVAGCSGTALDLTQQFNSVQPGASLAEIRLAMRGGPAMTQKFDVGGFGVVIYEYADIGSRYTFVTATTPFTDKELLAAKRQAPHLIGCGQKGA